jgi:hypothetical protein
MLDCKIDVTNKTDAITLDSVKSEFIRFYYLDHHHVYNKLLKHFLNMLDEKLVNDGDGEVLDRNSFNIIMFLDMEEVKNCQLDQELFEYLYDAICSLDEIKDQNEDENS